MKTPAFLRIIALMLSVLWAPLSSAEGGYFMFNAGSSEDVVFDQSETGFKIGAGAELSENIVGEVAFVYLGTMSFPLADISQFGFSGSIVPTLQLGESLSVFAKVGLFSWTFLIDDGFTEAEDTGVDLFVGAGINLQFGEANSLVFEYEQYEVSDGDVNLLSAGLKIGF